MTDQPSVTEQGHEWACGGDRTIIVAPKWLVLAFLKTKHMLFWPLVACGVVLAVRMLKIEDIEGAIQPYRRIRASRGSAA
jgi:hypothetical protein